MTVKEIFSQLEPLGDEKVRAHYRKSGVIGNLFGVKLGDIRSLARKIKINHPLALELWETGQVEARLLATLIMNPNLLSTAELDAMVRSEKILQIADWLSAYVIKVYPDKEKLRLEWMKSADPMAARAGWSLTAGRVSRDPEGLDLAALLKRIESEMPDAPPEVQWTMNTTLARIGISVPDLRQQAVAIGEKLGIYRNYPVSKGCTSPFAPIWINEMVSRV